MGSVAGSVRSLTSLGRQRGGRSFHEEWFWGSETADPSASIGMTILSLGNDFSRPK